MDELDRAGMQRDAAVAVRARGSVLQIAADRASYLRQLGSYLVVSSGEQLDFEQPVTIALGQQPVVEPGFLGVGDRTVVGFRSIRPSVAHEEMPETSRFGRGTVLSNSPIDFADTSVFDRLVHARERLARFGEQDRSADRAVDPVYDAQKDGSGFAVADADHLLDFVLESRIARRIGLDQLAGALVHDDQMVVFV